MQRKRFWSFENAQLVSSDSAVAKSLASQPASAEKTSRRKKKAKAATSSSCIGRRIAVMSFCCILITVAVTAVIMFTSSTIQTDSIVTADTDASMAALQDNLSQMTGNATKAVATLERDSDLCSEIKAKNTDILANTLEIKLRNISPSVDFLTVTDTEGTVLLSTATKEAGFSISEQSDVNSAMTGVSSKGALTEGKDVSLAIRAATPIVDETGAMIGMASAGYDLSSTNFLNSLKKSSACDYAIFLGDTCLGTTITQNNKICVGKKAPSDISAKVLKNDSTYSGQMTLWGTQFYAEFASLKNEDGKIVGMIFSGKPIGAINANRRKFLVLTILVTIVLSALSILIFNLFSRKKITAPIQSMSEFAARLAAGDLAADDKSGVQSKDEIGRLAQSLQTMAKNLRVYISDITEQLTEISKGNMTSEFNLEYIGDFAPIHEALKTIAESMNATLKQINQSADLVNRGSTEVASISQALSQGVAKQVTSVQELSEAIHDVSLKTEKTTSLVAHVNETAAKAAESVTGSSRKAEELLAAMEEIKTSSAQIEQIIHSIDSIAFQTNILALNAAVEAAHAGAAGKGFAVVADEVRNLAAKSAEASRQTAELIRSSQKKVETGFAIAEETAHDAVIISESLNAIISDIDEIHTAAKAQSAGVAQISASIQKVSDVVQTNSSTSEECAAASEDLSGQADLLRGEVGKFRLC
jgi:methyl-accepting chemotaxis protein